MATQEQNWWEQDETIQPATAPGYPGVIQGQPSQSKQASESRAETGTQINVSEEARAGRKEKFDYAKNLRDEFRKTPETVNYETVIRQFSSALGADATPTGDQALITAYAKMLDPGSVVREQEFNTVAAGDSKLGAIVARLQKEFGVDNSGLIRPEVRARVLREMKNLADNYRAGYDRARTDYEGLASSYELDPKLVLGTRIDEPYNPKIEQLWKAKVGSDDPNAPPPLEMGVSGGETYSTDKDKAITAAVQAAFQNGGSVEDLKAAAEAAGAVITPDDLANFKQAIDARAKRQPVTFTPQRTGRRNVVSQVLGEAAMTPLGTAVTGFTNAAGLGALSLVAGDQVKGLEALNPKAGFTGELVGSALGTAALAKAAKMGVGRVSGTLAERMAGGGALGAVAREVGKDAAYGGIYGANTGEGFVTGSALGALGSLGGQAVGGMAKRAIPAFRGMFRGGGENTIPPLGGGLDQTTEAPITRNRLYSDKIMGPEYQAGDVLPKYGMRNISGPDELQDIIDSGFVRARKEGGAKYYTMTDAEVPSAGNANAGKPIIRIQSGKIPDGRAARAEDVEVWNNNTQSWEKLIPEQGGGVRPNAALLAEGEEPFTPVTRRFNDAGASGTSGDIMRLSKAEGLPVPVELTQGAATRDAEQLAFEKEQIFGPLGGPLRARAEENNAQILQNFDRFIDMTGAELPDLASTGNAVTKALSAGYKQAKDRVNVAYKRAEAAGELAEPVSYKDVADFIAEQTPTTREKLAPILNAVDEQLRKNDPDGTGLVPLNALEQVRKLINKASVPGTENGNYGGQLKGLIDQATEGKGGALYKKARALRIEQARKYENRAVVERLVANVKNKADAKTTSDEVVRKSILTESPEDIKFLRHALKTSGKDGRQAWKELQGATIRHIQEQATKNVNLTANNEPVVSAAGLNRVVNELDKSGRLDAIFDPATAQRVRDLRDVVQYINTVPPGTSINNSGTARTLLAALAEMGVTGGATGVPLPLLTGLKVLRSAVQDNRIKKKISQSLIPKNSISAAQSGDYMVN